MVDENSNAAANAKAVPATEQIKAPTPKMQITINLMEGDQIQVNGPLDNEPLFDWMLKKAGEAAANYRVQRVREAAKPNTLLGRLKQLAPVRKH